MPRSRCRASCSSFGATWPSPSCSSASSRSRREPRHEPPRRSASLVVAAASRRRRRRVLPRPRRRGQQRLTSGLRASVGRSGERKVLYWHDPMVPGQRFDKPGKSPFMDMQLRAGLCRRGRRRRREGERRRCSRTSASATRRCEARRCPRRSTPWARCSSTSACNVAVQTRVAGYVERLAVRAPMERVRKGQALATVFAPDWLGPQNELVALEAIGRLGGRSSPRRASALRALSIPAELVRRSEEAGIAQARFTLRGAGRAAWSRSSACARAWRSSPGMTLFRIAGLQTVWAVAEVPEAQAARLVRGQKVKATLQADAVPDVRRRAEGDPAAGQRHDADAARPASRSTTAAAG